MQVLFVCTANQCRSPMAEGLFRLRAGQAGCEVGAASAGFLDPGIPVPAAVSEAMGKRGVDLSGHRSRRLAAPPIESSDVVVTMTGQHLLDTALLAGEGWSRCFTLADLVRRAEEAGPPTGGPSRAWVQQLHGDRQRSDILRAHPDDDIADPMGGRRKAFERTADELDGLVTRLIRAGCRDAPAART